MTFSSFYNLFNKIQYIDATCMPYYINVLNISIYANSKIISPVYAEEKKWKWNGYTVCVGREFALHMLCCLMVSIFFEIFQAQYMKYLRFHSVKFHLLFSTSKAKKKEGNAFHLWIYKENWTPPPGVSFIVMPLNRKYSELKFLLKLLQKLSIKFDLWFTNNHIDQNW